MKSVLAFFGVLLVSQLGHASTPRDTVRGEAHLTRRFTQSICEQLAMQSRHQDLTVLTKAQGMELLSDVLTAAIIRDSTAFQKILANAPDATVVVQRVSKQAVLGLSGACPAASKLLAQMGVHMSGIDTNLTTKQQHALQAVAHSFCEKLTAADARQAFSQCTAAERMAAFGAARHEVILAHGAALVEAFGQQLLANEQLENSLWQNVDRLMFDECRALTAQLRIDRGFAQLRAASEAPAGAPTPAATPRVAAPLRRKSREK